MGDARRIEVRPIARAEADALVSRVHYSGKSIGSSQLHLGVLLDGDLGGVMQFGPPMDRGRVMHLVEGATPASVVELNRMAFEEWLPRNAESRALAVAFRLLAKHAPAVKWCLSFADGTRCGDGAIYRASGFVLTGLEPNRSFWRFPDGAIVCSASSSRSVAQRMAEERGATHRPASAGVSSLREVGAVPLPGFMLRYIRFVDPTWRARLTVPEIPFSRIAELGASMYRGERPAPAASATAGVAGPVHPAREGVRPDPVAPPEEDPR